MGVMYDIHKNYLGGGNLYPKQGSIRRLLQIGADIRQKLGAQGFLFDRYLTLLLDAADAVSKEAMSDGFGDISSIYELISAALENKEVEEYKENRFYPRVKEYIETHPVSYYRSETRLPFYFIALFDEYVMFLLDAYMERQASWQHEIIDTIDMDKRYQKLCELAGDSLMTEFSQQMHLVFEITPIAKGYLQGAFNYLIYDMTSIEEESGRYVLLTMIDKILAGDEI